MAVSTSTALVPVDPVFTDVEHLALAGFLAGYRGSTREAYALDLRQFVVWCADHDRRLFDVHRVDIECFGRDLEAGGRARATVARRLCTVAGFYRYAEEEGLIEHSPAVHVRRPRVDYESHAVGLGRDELGALLVAAGSSSARDHALVSLLALNGLRVSEALGADIDALGLERGHRTVTVTRKGGKIVTMPLAPRVARAIDLAIGERLDGPIFVATNGERLDRHAAGRIVRRVARGAGSRNESVPIRSDTRSLLRRSTPASRSATYKRLPATPTRERPCATPAAASPWTGTPPTSWRPSSRAPPADPILTDVRRASPSLHLDFGMAVGARLQRVRSAFARQRGRCGSVPPVAAPERAGTVDMVAPDRAAQTPARSRPRSRRGPTDSRPRRACSARDARQRRAAANRSWWSIHQRRRRS
jgi:integrase/recombinase XerD